MIDHLFIIGYPSDVGGAEYRTVAYRQTVAALRAGHHPLAHLASRHRLAGPARCPRLPDHSVQPRRAGRRAAAGRQRRRLLLQHEVPRRRRAHRPARLPHDLARLHELALSPRATALSPLRAVRPARVPEPLSARSTRPPTPPLWIPGPARPHHPRGARRGRTPFPAPAARGGRGLRRRPHQPRRSRQVLAHAMADVRADTAIRSAARVLGWKDDVQARLGPPPAWAECLPAGAQAAAAFLKTLHALVQSSAAAVENWPRVGLEAMAAGVPLVVDAKGGWLEMLRHGRTGYLCRDGQRAGRLRRAIGLRRRPSAAAGSAAPVTL